MVIVQPPGCSMMYNHTEYALVHITQELLLQYSLYAFLTDSRTPHTPPMGMPIGQARNGDEDDSDGAEEDGFVGADTNGSQVSLVDGLPGWGWTRWGWTGSRAG